MDLALFETGNGGDFQENGNDLLVIEGFGQMIYLALFGGNVEAITKDKLPTELAEDYWGNNLFFPQNESVQFNSRTEKALNETPLTSAGRVIIQNAVNADLDFMKDFAEISVTVEIFDPNMCKITINANQPENLQGRNPEAYRAYVYIWDGTKLSLGDFSTFDFNNDFL